MPDRLRRAEGLTSPRTGSCQGSTNAAISDAIIGGDRPQCHVRPGRLLSYPPGVQATARSGPGERKEIPATRPASLMARAKLAMSPGRAPRPSRLNEPEPVGVQTAAWLVPSAVAESPATRPFASMAEA